MIIGPYSRPVVELPSGTNILCLETYKTFSYDLYKVGKVYQIVDGRLFLDGEDTGYNGYNGVWKVLDNTEDWEDLV